eukprot:TRINITY_DN76126_c0_g1_i7.p1 TRINITY_DN76126_c0_g1~~TRINITY_DN76126_c0_g1_i7.p1  ORF type:complete len:60 (+),score=5.24 TRINITY_DN76126_c0_g1_i7:116-295(+)
MSRSYGGSFSDREILEREHDFIDQLHPSENIFANSEFSGTRMKNFFKSTTNIGQLQQHL